MARAFECKCIPHKDCLACCLLALNTVSRRVLCRILVVHKTVRRNDKCGIAPLQTVKGRIVLELDVTKHGVEVGYYPAYRVGLGGNLNFRVLRVVDALDILQEVLASKGNNTLGYVLACKDHLRQSNDFLNCPLASVIEFLLHLVAHTFGEVDGLCTDLGGLNSHLAFTTCIESTVAAHLEVGNGGFCNHGLAERNFLLLRFVVVRYNLVHAALLKINHLCLWHDEVGVNFLLCLVESIGKNDEC